MVKKYITPIIRKVGGEQKKVVGTQVDYRLFGLLIYRKVMNNPSAYGLNEWEFIHRI